MPGIVIRDGDSFEAALKKKVTPYEWGKEVVPGLLAAVVAAPAETGTSRRTAAGLSRLTCC